MSLSAPFVAKPTKSTPYFMVNKQHTYKFKDTFEWDSWPQSSVATSTPMSTTHLMSPPNSQDDDDEFMGNYKVRLASGPHFQTPPSGQFSHHCFSTPVNKLVRGEQPHRMDEPEVYHDDVDDLKLDGYDSIEVDFENDDAMFY